VDGAAKAIRSACRLHTLYHGTTTPPAATRVHDGHGMALDVDSVDHAVGASVGAVPVVEWWAESFPDAVRVLQQRAVGELAGGEGHRLGEPVVS
jgi:hypothetical protein